MTLYIILCIMRVNSIQMCASLIQILLVIKMWHHRNVHKKNSVGDIGNMYTT